jgi:hypothetical protein
MSKNMTNYLSNSTKTIFPISISGKTAAGRWTIWHVGAGVGLLGGFLILFGAWFLIVSEYFLNEKSRGVWLFLAVLPLWIIGAHCFDKIEETDKAEREAYCRKHGIN